MRTTYLVTAALLVVCFGCRPVQHTQVAAQPAKQYVFSCFSDWDYHVESYGNMRLTRLENDAYIKQTAVSDSTYVLSCGNAYIEWVYDTFGCSNPAVVELDFSNEMLMVLYEKGGSNSWMNSIWYYPADTVYQTQAYYIDTVHYRFVDWYVLSVDKRQADFAVTDMHNGSIAVVPSRYYQFRADGAPDLHIGNVQLNENKLMYTVFTNEGEVRDTLVVGD